MEKIQLGHTDLQITRMGMGNVDFGTKIDRKTAFRVLDAYMDLGGNFLDTSNNYALWNPGGYGGECEKVIGEWMKSRGNRNRIVLATKAGANIADLKTVLKPDGTIVDDWFLHGEGLSEKAITEAIEGSLRRLQTDCIDLYYAHVEDPSVDPGETMKAFDKLYRQGKIRAIGASNHSPWRVERARQISKANGWIEYCCMQDFHTYLQPLPSRRSRYAGPGVCDYIRNNPSMSLISYTPTLWGKYSQMEGRTGADFWGEFYTVETDEKVKRLRNLAKKYSATVIQIVYAWILRNNPPAIPLIATSSIEHLKENMEAEKLMITKEDMDILNQPAHL